MAEEAIENELHCSICLDTYTDPKILQCFHVYCQRCLVRLVIQDQQRQLSLSCPTCRQVTPVPANGTAGLPSAFRVNRLLEILDQHKKVDEGASEKRLKTSFTDKTSKDLAIFSCSEHEGREVELFCETCEQLLCMKCVIKGSKHHSHNYKDINESFERYKEQVASLLKPMEIKMKAVTTILSELDRHCNEISRQRLAIEADISAKCRELHEVISSRQQELVHQLDQITKRKLKSLSTQKDEIETVHAQFKSCLEFTRESLKTDVQPPEVLVMKTSILTQMRGLATSSQPGIFTPSTADIIFSVSEDAKAICKGYGRVYALTSPDPSKCVATGSGTEAAVVGEKASVILSALNFNGEPCKEATVSASFEIDLESEITGNHFFSSIEGHPEDGEQGQYEISYQPNAKGKHLLHIKADNQDIFNSPFNVIVNLPVQSISTPILSLSGLGKPIGVAVNRKGEVVVAEYGKSRISVHSPRGEKLRSFGSHGSGEGQFKGLIGVTVDAEGNLIAADHLNDRVQKFTADGCFLNSVGSLGSGTQNFNRPFSVAYSTINNKIYVSDMFNHRVQILTSDLDIVGAFGEEGKRGGQFVRPHGVATDSTGRVYVADHYNHRIQVFTAEGKFLRRFGRWGTGRGELKQPEGVAVDASGLVYVSEYSNHRISVFNSEGEFVTSFGSEGTGPGQFDRPCGVAVDSSGVVYVCDIENSRVQLF